VRTKTPLQADKILRVAARLFATHHFHQARREDIAAAAEVGKGTLYRYFKDKEELYLALLERAAEGLSSRLVELETLALGPRDRLEAMVESLISFFDEHPHLFDLIQHAEVMSSHDQEIPWNRTRQETVARLRKVLEEGEELGLFRVADPELSVLLLLGGIRAVLRFGQQPRPPDLARQIVACFLQGHGTPACSLAS